MKPAISRLLLWLVVSKATRRRRSASSEGGLGGHRSPEMGSAMAVRWGVKAGDFFSDAGGCGVERVDKVGTAQYDIGTNSALRA